MTDEGSLLYSRIRSIHEPVINGFLSELCFAPDLTQAYEAFFQDAKMGFQRCPRVPRNQRLGYRLS